MNTTAIRDSSNSVRQSIWVALVAVLSIVFSLALACATPFAAIATVAGANMTRRGALMLTATAWLANQAVGYFVLFYPATWDSFAWGAAIGIAAALATVAVSWLRDWVRSGLLTLLAGFVLAFFVYELVLFAATAILPSGEDAFSLAVILQILWPNVLALVGLALLHKVALSVGLLSRPASVGGDAYA